MRSFHYATILISNEQLDTFLEHFVKVFFCTSKEEASATSNPVEESPMDTGAEASTGEGAISVKAEGTAEPMDITPSESVPTVRIMVPVLVIG